MKRIYI